MLGSSPCGRGWLWSAYDRAVMFRISDLWCVGWSAFLIYRSIHPLIVLQLPRWELQACTKNWRTKQQSKNFTQKINAFRKERMSKSTRKINGKPIQNSAWEMPGRGLGDSLGPRWPFRAGFQTQPKADEKIEGFWDAPGTSREAPGDSEGPKNQPKIALLLKNYFPIVDSLSILERSTVLRAFWAMWHRFVTDNPWEIDEKTWQFLTAACVFLKVATLTKHCILWCESYFFIFCFCMFSKKT